MKVSQFSNQISDFCSFTLLTNFHQFKPIISQIWIIKTDGSIKDSLIYNIMPKSDSWINRMCLPRPAPIFLHLSEINIERRCIWKSNGSKSSIRKNHGGSFPSWPRYWCLCPVHNLDLYSLSLFTCSGQYWVNAADQILSATCCSIVPYPFPCCSKEVARWELCCITPKTCRRCIWWAILAGCSKISLRIMEEVSK